MWHNLDAVADSCRLDRDDFRDFVIRCHSKELDDYGMISTWDVDFVVAQYAYAMKEKG